MNQTYMEVDTPKTNRESKQPSKRLEDTPKTNRKSKEQYKRLESCSEFKKLQTLHFPLNQKPMHTLTDSMNYNYGLPII